MDELKFALRIMDRSIDFINEMLSEYDRRPAYSGPVSLLVKKRLNHLKSSLLELKDKLLIRYRQNNR